MNSIADFAARRLELNLTAGMPTREVTLRGVSVTVAALSCADELGLRVAYPIPNAPLGPDPSKGSDAQWVPNRSDPKYIADSTAAAERWSAARALKALRWADSPDELMRCFSAKEIDDLNKVIDDLSSWGSYMGVAAKN